MRLKKGDLVRPMVRCGGEPGDRRCGIALVIDTPNRRSDCYTIVCPCGWSMEYGLHLERIERKWMSEKRKNG